MKRRRQRSDSASAAREALDGISRDASRARLGDRIPEDRRPSPQFMVSIGLAEPKEEDDPDAETHGYAFDDDPTLPGSTRKRRRSD